LTFHSRHHLIVNSFKCSECALSFLYKNNLNRHMRRSIRRNTKTNSLY
jgi:hypothetical protein